MNPRFKVQLLWTRAVYVDVTVTLAFLSRCEYHLHKGPAFTYKAAPWRFLDDESFFWNGAARKRATHSPGRRDDKCVMNVDKHADFLTTVWQEEQRPEQTFTKSWGWLRGTEGKTEYSRMSVSAWSAGRDHVEKKRGDWSLLITEKEWMSNLTL